jgi:hypothetical protein
VKTTLTVFFYAKGIIHHEFVLEERTVNSTFYKEVIKILRAQICVRSEFQESGSWYLVHNNALVHYLGVISQIFGEARDHLVIPSTLLP